MNHQGKSQKNVGKLYKKVFSKKILNAAWRSVRSNGLKSSSSQTNLAIEEFDKQSIERLDQLAKQLKEKKFKFSAIGHPIPKKGSNKVRPLTVFNIESRIVNRAILNILQQQKPVKKFLAVKNSFGGIEGKSVPEAIATVTKSINDGAKFYIRSDIKEFFTQIPSSKVLSIIAELIDDNDFLELTKQALTVEVSNIQKIQMEHKEFYDFDQRGVPQGSSLSPLVSNILLYEFDMNMNHGDIVCIRFLDDFILLAPTNKAVSAAFKRAQKLLSAYSLSAYDPHEKSSQKASFGPVSSKFTFLGIEFSKGLIRPHPSVRNKLDNEIEAILSQCLISNFDSFDKANMKKSVVQSLQYVSNKLKGWGSHYKFCNDQKIFEEIDKQVDEKLEKFIKKMLLKIKQFESKKSPQQLRRFLGVQLIQDAVKLKSDQI